ncbi:sterol o-acyltransferase [Anaeramoeba flamelloides]|uniref:Sterol o-acyltransferase n=1 Tax=Anaeramoeba flamelloides TaxID=1746091 RepID=A0ABQ8YFI9_9EUKA|nr:sterol o-acyltransferase [Anaeramoeba flamelloides]
MSFPSNKVTEKEIENNKNDQVTEKEKQLAKNEVEILEEEEKEKKKETEKEKQKEKETEQETEQEKEKETEQETEKEKEQTKEDHNKKNVTNKEQKKTTYPKKEYPKPKGVLLAGALTLYMIIYILKIHSWYFTADKLEENLKSNPNAKFSNYLYFLLAPTLIYKNNFEKKEKRRKIYICYKFVSFILGLLGIWLVYLNYLEPIFIESTNYFFWMLPLDTVRLIIPIQLIWWGIFMTFFRAMLKLTAELLKWKDNRFYDDWWNAHNVREFWKKWNVMFHKFASHHIFKFLLQNSNVSATISFGAVFIVSGILHEILICSAFRVFSFQWFLSFIIQIFLVIGQSKLPIGLRNGNGGNLIFWSTLFFGLPGLSLWYRRLLLLKTVTNGAI